MNSFLCPSLSFPIPFSALSSHLIVLYWLLHTHLPPHCLGDIPACLSLRLLATQQWTSKEAEKEASAHGHHLLPPLFSHGSSVGLYGTLRGRGEGGEEYRHTYTVTAASLLHGFFIPRSNLEAARDADSSVEDFLWKVRVVGGGGFRAVQEGMHSCVELTVDLDGT